jgi:MFS superfamily sulfate permease-like transporter
MSENRKKSTLAADLPAGLVVFLVALPLCLGIATASGATPLAGIIAGAVGGVLVGILSGSPLSVSGPAAGLVAIVTTALTSLQKEGISNPYTAFQVALVLAGGIQVLMGILRLGVIANFVPNSVIKGMLAGIGVVIILKQIPHALGRDQDYEGSFSFLNKLGNTFVDIAEAVMSASPGAILIFAVSVAIILFWESKTMKKMTFTKFIPGALIAVVAAAVMNEVFRGAGSNLALFANDGHLVQLPQTADLMKSFTFPNWQYIGNNTVIVTAVTLAVVASVETLLSIDAADKLDVQRRVTPTNKELVAQGIGNAFSGFVGGLPLTSVVVRSSANAYSGASTKASTIFHGVLLAIAAASIPFLLNKIPLACLAAVLILVGWKLTKPAIYTQMYGNGMDQFLPFVVTVLGVVFTDLLKGVILGILVGLFFVIKSNQHKAMILVNDGSTYLLRFNKDITFTSKASLQQELGKVPPNSDLIVNGTKADFIDHDIVDMLNDFIESAKYRNIGVELKDINDKTWVGNMRRFGIRKTKEIKNGQS